MQLQREVTSTHIHYSKLHFFKKNKIKKSLNEISRSNINHPIKEIILYTHSGILFIVVIIVANNSIIYSKSRRTKSKPRSILQGKSKLNPPRANQSANNTRRRWQREQRYLRLKLKQTGKQRRRTHLTCTSMAATFPPQYGHAPGACCLPNSFSSPSHNHPIPIHIDPPFSFDLFLWFLEQIEGGMFLCFFLLSSARVDGDREGERREGKAFEEELNGTWKSVAQEGPRRAVSLRRRGECLYGDGPGGGRG